MCSGGGNVGTQVTGTVFAKTFPCHARAVGIHGKRGGDGVRLLRFRRLHGVGPYTLHSNIGTESASASASRNAEGCYAVMLQTCRSASKLLARGDASNALGAGWL